MKSRLLLNLVLVCVVAALVVVAVFEPGKEKPRESHLTSIDESGVESFTLQARETIVFERKDGHWWLKSPIAAPANEIRVHQLLDAAHSEIDAEYPLSQEDLPKYELDQPSAILTIGDQVIRFGGSDPIDMRRYIQIGDTLYLVKDDFSHHLTAAATDFIDKKLLPEDAKVTSIEVPGTKATLGEDGKWVLEPAAADSVSKSASLLNAWQAARAIDVKKMEKSATGEVVRIGLAGGTVTEFVILQRDPELVLGRSDWGIQYELVGEIAKQLLGLSVSTDGDKAAGTADEGEDADEDGAEEDADPDQQPDAEEDGSSADPDLDNAEDPDEGEGEEME